MIKRQLMRSVPAYAFLLLLLIGCKDQKRSKNDAIEVVDTQMAELVKSPPLARKDSLKFLNFWNRFSKFLANNDTDEIFKLSLKLLYCPVYSKEYNYYKDSKLVPTWFFINAPCKQNYITSFSSYLNKDTPTIYSDQLDNQEIFDLGFDSGKIISAFSVYYNTEEITGNYKIWRTHQFKFIQNNGNFKFIGLKVEENGSQYQWKLMPVDSLYFPVYTKAADSIANNFLNNFSNRLFSQYLLQFKEPRIYTPQSGDEVYRFLWIRSFNNPVVIRFQKHNNTYTLHTKEMLNYEGYIPQQMKVNTEEEMSAYEWNIFKEKVNDLDFWNVVGNEPKPGLTTDGALWILEGSTKNKYHFIERDSPEDGKFQACCKYLLSLTQLKIPEKDQY